MDSGDPKKFASELGDLLLQIIFHSLIASESHRFEIRDVIESIHTKMVRRHPHVFGNVKAKTSAQVLRNWEQLKSEERRKEDSGEGKRSAKQDSILASVPRSLPALMEAHQLTRRAANIGFDWTRISELLEKLAEETQEIREALAAESSAANPRERSTAPAKNGAKKSAAASAVSAPATAPPASDAVSEEIGDLLFTAANLARFAGLDPEITLKKANRKFAARFQWMEQEAQRRGAPLAETPRDTMENLWNASKERH